MAEAHAPLGLLSPEDAHQNSVAIPKDMEMKE